MKRILITLMTLLLAAGASSAQTFDELYAKTDKFRSLSSQILTGPVRPVWKDAETFVYTTKEASGDKYYEVNVATGTKTEMTKEAYTEASRPAAPARAQGAAAGDMRMMMQRSPLRESPDGKWVAYIKDNNVWISENDGKARPAQAAPAAPNAAAAVQLPATGIQLSFDGTDNDQYAQVQWSPDSKKLSAVRRTTVETRQIMLRESRPADQIQPKYRWLNYAKPGDALSQSAVTLFDVEKKVQIPFDMSPYTNQYNLRIGQWSPNSDYFTFEYNQRGHQLYQLVAVDAVTGKGRVIAEEKTDTFVYYNTLYRYYFKDGKRILWISERDDWRHLYMVDATSGSIRQITKGEWNVREILKLDEEAGYILMNANGVNAGQGEDPYNKHVLRLDLNTGKWVDLTPENANHLPTFNRDYTWFVDNYSRPDMPGTSVVRSAVDGSVKMQLQKTDISQLLKTGFTMPEVFVAKGRDGKTDIWGTIYRPSNFNPRKKYPVVEYIYSGPHDSYVEKDFLPGTPRFIRLIEMGFIVVYLDAMGTDNRSKSFQDVAWRNLKDAGFPDRILWIKAAAAKYKYMDISKMGIYGYSAGGQNTLAALLFHPEFYKVGVALCGCHDNRMDKIWWNEQWMGYPIGPWYGENSNVDNAWRLEGKLFIINGEMDDNVDPASTLQVVSELVKHNKDFEQLHLPGHTHNLGSEYINRRVFKFFWENCR